MTEAEQQLAFIKDIAKDKTFDLVLRTKGERKVARIVTHNLTVKFANIIVNLMEQPSK